MAEIIKRTLGDIKFPNMYQPTGQNPLDDRMVVQTKALLTDINTWSVGLVAGGDPVWYEGMVVSVKDEDALYLLVNNGKTLPDPTDEHDWKKIGSPELDITGKMVEIVKENDKYYDNTDDPQHTTEITDPTVLAGGEGTYLKLTLSSDPETHEDDDYVYIKSNDLIDLTDYYKKSEVDTKLANLDSSLSAYVDDEIEAVEELIADNTEAISAINDKLVEVDSSIDTLQERADVLDASVNAIEAEQAKQNSSIGALDASVKDYAVRIEELENEGEEASEEIEAINSSIDRLDSSVNILEVATKDLQDYIKDVVDNSINKAEKRLQVVDSSIASLDASVKDHEDRITELEAAGEKSEEDIEVINSSLERINTSVNTIENYIANVIDNSVNLIEGRMDTAEADIDKLDSSMNKVENRMAAAEEAIEAANASIDRLDTSVNALEDRTAAVEDRLDEIDSLNEEVEQHLEDLDASVKVIDASIAKIDSSVKDLRNDVDDVLASYVKTVAAESLHDFVSVAPTTASKGDVTVTVDLSTATMAEVETGANGLAVAADVKQYVDTKVAALHQFSYKVVDSIADIPVSAEGMYIIYLVKCTESADTSKAGDVYEEWIVVEQPVGEYHLELLGDTKIDLKDYAKTADVNASLAAMQQEIDDLDSSIKNALAELSEDIEDYVADLSTRINANANAIEALDEKVDEAVVDLSTRINANTEAIEALEEKASQDLMDLSTRIDASIKALDIRVATNESEIERLDSSVKDLIAEDELINETISNILEHTAATDASIARLDSSVNALDASVKDIIDTIETGVVNTFSSSSEVADFITVTENTEAIGDVNVVLNAKITDASAPEFLNLPNQGLATVGYVEERLDQFNWIEIEDTASPAPQASTDGVDIISNGAPLETSLTAIMNSDAAKNTTVKSLNISSSDSEVTINQ